MRDSASKFNPTGSCDRPGLLSCDFLSLPRVGKHKMQIQCRNKENSQPRPKPPRRQRTRKAAGRSSSSEETNSAKRRLRNISMRSVRLATAVFDRFRLAARSHAQSAPTQSATQLSQFTGSVKTLPSMTRSQSVDNRSSMLATL